MGSKEQNSVSVGFDQMEWADGADNNSVKKRISNIFATRPPPLKPRSGNAAMGRTNIVIVISEPQSDSPPRPRRLFRGNSVSLPAINNMDPRQQKVNPMAAHHDGDITSDDDTFTSGEGLSEEETVAVQMPLRNSRRKSVLPPRLKVNDGDFLEVPEHSPQNSITSINSISSLLKEKLALSLPAMLKKKKPQQYKLRAFVGILFLCIVFLVGFAYLFYHQQVLQRAYFDCIRFNNEERVVRVFSTEGQEVLYGSLGTLLGSDPVFHCLPRDERGGGSVCMEWMHKARLHMEYSEQDGVRCYRVVWDSLTEGQHPTDCFDWSGRHGHWYGGGQTRGMSWPLEQGTVAMAPFVTGETTQHQWGNVLRRYFINSRGVAITVDPDTPLYTSVGRGKFCLQARHDDFAYTHRATPLPRLNYSVCTSDNMKSLHLFLADKNLWDGLKERELKTVYALLREPVWEISRGAELTESVLYNFTEDVISLGFFLQGHVLLDETWQTHVGDLTLDPTRFPTMEDTINIIHRRGFRIVLTVQPFISTESSSFREAVHDGLLVGERGRPRIPALTSYRGVASAGVLDVTNNQSLPWFTARLRALVDRYHVDAFYLDVGTAYDMPLHHGFESELTNLDQYKTLLTEGVVDAVGVVGVSSAIARPRAPVFVSLPPFSSTWESMKAIIPTVLTYGIVGYPFIMPGAVGGDGLVEGQAEVRLPDKELYVRWLQLATFLPVMRYTHLPSKYGDDEVLKMARELTALRLETVIPLLQKYVREALDSGVPIVRPLWLLDPSDPACHMVVDEFSVGDELIVAPIIYPRVTEREVYLPAGVWRDGIDGSLRKGSRWLHSYRVAHDKVAYFVKMPDNTRF